MSVEAGPVMVIGLQLVPKALAGLSARLAQPGS
jgi:hypothetical protein